MAASSAVLSLKAIPKKPNGHSIILIANFDTEKDKYSHDIGFSPVRFKIMLRAHNDEIGNYLREKAMQVIEATAKVYDVKFKFEKIEESSYPAWPKNSPELVDLAIETWKEMGNDENIIIHPFGELGSDDVIYIMREVIQNGGKAAYIGLVSDDNKGAFKNIYTDRFNVKDDFFEVGVNLITKKLMD